MLNFKKFTLGFSCACLLAFSSSLCFASDSPKTVVPATNLPEATINTTIDMSRSIDSQNITAVPATNLSDETINTKIDTSVSFLLILIIFISFDISPKLQLSPIKKIALTVFHN